MGYCGYNLEGATGSALQDSRYAVSPSVDHKGRVSIPAENVASVLPEIYQPIDRGILTLHGLKRIWDVPDSD
jgi:hypothetical protein